MTNQMVLKLRTLLEEGGLALVSGRNVNRRSAVLSCICAPTCPLLEGSGQGEPSKHFTPQLPNAIYANTPLKQSSTPTIKIERSRTYGVRHEDDANIAPLHKNVAELREPTKKTTERRGIECLI